ncbi:hypothetical protein M6B38_157265 [Iris pallida]|uniref:Uncharacterized protein n=1 Tax=Iris pallida TaxID=29817 RepID=A0AAX6F0R9_IRIPA|nr:hypothetical protein M6B38_157265 [Iris pallida]
MTTTATTQFFDYSVDRAAHPFGSDTLPLRRPGSFLSSVARGALLRVSDSFGQEAIDRRSHSCGERIWSNSL